MSFQALRPDQKPNLVEVLSEIMGRPESCREVPLEAIPGMLAQLAAAQSMLAARLMELMGKHENSGHAEGDRLLTVEEAAQRLGVAPD